MLHLWGIDWTIAVHASDSFNNLQTVGPNVLSILQSSTIEVLAKIQF